MTDTALATATVVWRARAVGQDTDDPGNAPQEYPLAWVKVRLIPSPRKIEVAAPPGGVAPTTYTLRTWDLVTREDGSLVNPEDPGEGGSEAAGVQIVASDAIEGVQIEWTSIIDAPDSGVPAITKVWLAPAGSTVDLTTVESIPPSPGSLAEYLQAVRDARAARDIAVASGAAASAAAASAAESARLALLAAEVEQVTLTGNLAYVLPAGVAPNRVHSVVFTQDGVGGHTVTYGGAAVNVNTAAGSRTSVEVVPDGAGGRVLTYPTATLVAVAGAYPPRPPLAPGCVTYKGTAQPADWLTGDEWQVI